jgi:hypothetical protein
MLKRNMNEKLALQHISTLINSGKDQLYQILWNDETAFVKHTEYISNICSDAQELKAALKMEMENNQAYSMPQSE